MELDGYIRVSRVAGREGDSFISPKAQREKVEDYARARGYSILEWHEDLDWSGAREERPGFQAALERVEAKQSGGIIVAKLDRFARSVADATNAIKRIQAADGQLVSVEDGFDSQTAMGKFAIHLLLALGELERDRIRANWETAQEFAVRRGVHIASKVPTGYRRGEGKRLVPDGEAGEVVGRVFEERAAGASLSELAAMLTREKVRSPHGSPRWSGTAVAKILKNPVYTGEARGGRHKNAEAHEALVSRATWQAAQRARAAAPKRSVEGSLLASLLRCAGCRYVMKADKMTLKNGPQAGERVRIYRCKNDYAAGKCGAPASVMGRVIEPWVVSQLFEGLGQGGVLARSSPRGGEVEEAERALQAAEEELEAFVDATSVREVGKEVFARGVEARQRRVAEAQVRVGELRGSDESAIPELSDLREVWPELSVGDQRRILAAGVDAVMLRRGRNRPVGERAVILWRGEIGQLGALPSRGRHTPLAPFKWPESVGAD